jgi:hypothetical protein
LNSGAISTFVGNRIVRTSANPASGMRMDIVTQIAAILCSDQ